VYYYNAETKQSSWEKPAELMTEAERAAAQGSQWKEYKTAEGRVYWYHKGTKQSTWTMPDELKAAQPAAQPAAAKPAAAEVPSVEEISKAAAAAKPKDGTLRDEFGVPIRQGGAAAPSAAPGAAAAGASAAAAADAEVYVPPPEAKADFKRLLLENKVRSTWKWETAMRKVVGDARYAALKTLSARKQCFEEYQRERKAVEQQEVRRQAQDARAGLLELLDECPELQITPQLQVAAGLLGEDPRWRAVKNSQDLEYWFEDWLRHRDRREKEKRKEKQRDAEKEFRKLLEEQGPWLTSVTEWRKAQARLQGEIQARCEGLDKLACLDVFQAHVRALERKEDEERAQRREAERKEDRAARDAFHRVLVADRKAGKIDARTRWKDYRKRVEKSEEYAAVEGTKRGPRARELFEDVMDDVDAEVDRQKKGVRAYLQDHGRAVSASTDLAAFLKMLDKFRSLDKISDINRAVIHEELVERAKEKEAKEERRKRRAVEDFQDILRDTPGLSRDLEWPEALRLAAKAKYFPDVSKYLGPEELAALFAEWKGESAPADAPGGADDGKKRGRSGSAEAGPAKKARTPDDSEEEGEIV